jgi:hypothetical protein
LAKGLKLNQEIPKSDITDICNTADIIDMCGEDPSDVNDPNVKDKLDNGHNSRKEIEKGDIEDDKGTLQLKQIKCLACPTNLQFQLSDEEITCCCSRTKETMNSDETKTLSSVELKEFGSSLTSYHDSEETCSAMEINLGFDPVPINTALSNETANEAKNAGEFDSMLNLHSQTANEIDSTTLNLTSVAMELPVEGTLLIQDIVVQSEDCAMKTEANKNEILISCQFCSVQFKTYALRHQHLISNHTQIKESLTSDSILHTCLICSKQFPSNMHLAKHMVNHTKANKNKHTCDDCGKSFKDKSHLSVHIFVHTSEKPFACQQCEKGYKREKDLERHQQMHQGPTMTCILCSFQCQGKQIYRRHLMNVHQGKHECKECGKKCVSKSILEKHNRKHTGEKPFVCEHCKVAFAQPGGLKSHKQALHTKQEKNFICDQCPISFRTIFLLRNHSKSVHGQERNYQCTACGKDYKTASHLKQHMEIHSGLTVQCESCPKTFACKENYRKHLSREHAKTKKN